MYPCLLPRDAMLGILGLSQQESHNQSWACKTKYVTLTIWKKRDLFWILFLGYRLLAPRHNGMVEGHSEGKATHTMMIKK